MNPLTEKCSLYRPYYLDNDKFQGWAMGTKPEKVNIIDMLIWDLQSEKQAAVQQEKEKDKRDPLKRQLLAITPCSISEGGRGMKYVVEHNGLIQFDIDPKENEILTTPEGIIKVKDFLVNIPYTVYCGISASGLGLWGLFKISHPHLHSQHFDAMSEEFKRCGIIIDQAPRSPASLRFVSYDPEGFFNEMPLLFDKRVEPKKVHKKIEISKNKDSNNNEITGKQLGDIFNSKCTPGMMDEILMNFGFNYHSHLKESYRYTRPDKKTNAGLSVDYHTKKRTLYCFSSSVPGLNHWKSEKAGWSCSPLTALLLYGFGGFDKQHWAQAYSWITSHIKELTNETV